MLTNPYKKHLLAFAFGLTITAACEQNADKKQPPNRTVFFDKSGMDTTILPGNDFFAYANGTWVKKTKIPDDQTRWGSFAQLVAENQQKTKTVLETVAQANPPAGSLEQQIGDFYTSGMDTATINRRGYEPLKTELAKIAAITTRQQLMPYLVTDESYMGSVYWYGPGSSALISYLVGPDDRQSRFNRINFRQTGLSLPEKGYYTRTDTATQKIRTALVEYITTLFRLTGMNQAVAQTKARAILTFETRLAQSHTDQTTLRDPVANYHKLTVAELTRQMPGLNWRGLLNRMGLPRTDTVLIGQPAYYQALDRLLVSTPIDLLKDKLLFDALDYNAPLLGQAFEQASFAFNNKALYGQPKIAERWKRIAARADEQLSDPLGQLWVKQYFPPEAKQRVLTLIANIQTVYRKRIEKLDWMAPQTKVVAFAKLDKLVRKIGYPDQWKNYSTVSIKPDDYYGNVQRTRQYRVQLALANIDHPLDRQANWLMTPLTVNAYADPQTNEIAFPAGILQFPYFDNQADDAINYGAIGMIIGHELTHMFDDEGRQYDAEGNLRDWWAKQDAVRFTAKARRVVDQYNAFTMLDGLHLNGRLTLGENLADLGGVLLAYEAFKLTKQGQSSTKIDGFTPDQRFFLGLAQAYRMKVRDETTRARLLADPHSPPQFRINGPLSNFEPFYRAFNVKVGQNLYKSEDARIKVW